MKKEIRNTKTRLPERMNPFSTPDSYFDSFSERLMSRIDNECVPETQEKTSFYRILRPALIMAASFAAVFFIIFIPVHTTDPELTSKSNDHTIELVDIMAFYFMDENEIINAFENDDTYYSDNDAVLEEYLMASITEYDLVDFKN